MNLFLDDELFKEVLNTYADAEPENNWNALFLMAEIFRELQKPFAKNLCFKVNTVEAENSL